MFGSAKAQVSVIKLWPDKIAGAISNDDYTEKTTSNESIKTWIQKGGHGYGLAPGQATQSAWPELCLRWLKASGF